MSKMDSQLATMADGIKELMFGIRSQSEQMGILTSTVKNLDSKYGELSVEMTDMNGRIKHLEEDQFVDLIKADNIRHSAQSRVAELLEIEWDERGGVSDESMHDYKFYYSKFIGRLHHDARNAGLEGPRIYATPRKNYDALLNYINDWQPLRGVKGLKAYYDKMAATNRKKRNK